MKNGDVAGRSLGEVEREMGERRKRAVWGVRGKGAERAFAGAVCRREEKEEGVSVRCSLEHSVAGCVREQGDGWRGDRGGAGPSWSIGCFQCGGARDVGRGGGGLRGHP